MEEQDQTYLSTRQGAKALGVGVSTIKRWVDTGVISAHRTSGGHRKLLRAELLSLARQGKLPSVNLAALQARPPRGRLSLASLRKELTESALTGDQPRIRSLLSRVREAAISLDTLADQVIAPAMQRIGQEWECTRIDVWQEHRATQILHAELVYLLGQLPAPQSHDRPLAIGAAPDQDPYQLALLLGQMALIEAGWRALNLGPQTPLRSLVDAIRRLRPRLLWISVSHLPNPEQFADEYRLLQMEASRQSVAIAMGGQGLTPELRERLGYAMFGSGISDLVQFAGTLHTTRPRPRRGRPPKAG